MIWNAGHRPGSKATSNSNSPRTVLGAPFGQTVPLPHYFAFKSNFSHVRERVWTLSISMLPTCHWPFTFLNPSGKIP